MVDHRRHIVKWVYTNTRRSQAERGWKQNTLIAEVRVMQSNMSLNANLETILVERAFRLAENNRPHEVTLQVHETLHIVRAAQTKRL